jgi:sugar transferase (PEP-CTERM system associated)
MRVNLMGYPMRSQMLLLALIEIAAFLVAPYLAVVIRFSDDIASVEGRLGPLWSRGVIFASAMAIGLLATGLYSGRQRSGVDGILFRIVASSAGAFVVLALFFYVVPDQFIGRGVLGLTVGIGAVMCAFIRAITSRLVDQNIFKRRVLVFGSGVQASSISLLRRRTDQRGFYIVGYVKCPDEISVVASDRLRTIDGSLLSACRLWEVDEIVVAMDDRRRSFPVQDLLDCRLSGIDVLDLPTFLERETGKVRLDVLNPSWIIFGKGFDRSGLRQFSNRVFDLVACLLLLSASLPVMFLTALCIKLEDGLRAPVIYRQKRVGFEGRDFDLLKFRSMRVDAEKNGIAQWASEEDPRITRVGRIIRKIRVDELPQILNVLRGDMNFVGPRPERPEFVSQLSKSISYYGARHFVRPGITGWAQLCYAYGASERDAIEKLQYDLYYIKNHSFLFDLSILLQTAEVVLWKKGSR